MSDPERISKRSFGLAAQLLQAGAEERPSAAGVERTLSALAASGAIMTAAGGATAAGALTASATAASATAKTVGGLMLAKWIGAGVLGGVALSGAAAAVSSPARPSPSISVAVAAPSAKVARAAAVEASSAGPALEQPVAPVASEEAPSALPVPAQRTPGNTAPNDEALEVGAPLAAEVAAIDRARSLLSGGQAEQGLAELRRYEREFPQARLLPEVLFLRMETLTRLGRDDEARAAATRLLQGFPQSPHATRARKLVSQ